MKDTVHHLKYLQKKVIQSSRKMQAAEPCCRETDSVAPVISTEVSPVHKKKQFDEHLRKSMMRLHVH